MTDAAVETEPSWEQLERLTNEGQTEALHEAVLDLGPKETFRALLRMPDEARGDVLGALAPTIAADLLEELPDEHAADLLESLSIEQIVPIIEELDPNDQADVLGEFEPAEVESILATMPVREAADVRTLIRYDAEVAGGLMTTDFLSYEEGIRADRVIADLEGRAPAREDTHETYVYVLSSWGKLVGVLDFRELAIADGAATLATIANLPHYLLPSATLEELDDFFDRHDFLAVPIVDERLGLVGIVHREDLQEALVERAEHDLLKRQGIVGGDELRTLPTLVRARRRLSWLTVNIGLNIAAASVIAAYEDTLSAAIALAVFLPIVSDMSGCSGNQAVAVSMRELSLGVIRPSDALRVWWQEIRVGLINGIVLGVLLGLAAYAWKGNPYLGVVVGAALALNTLLAVSIGGTVPLLLKRFGADPAVASGPILTTLTDMCGFFLVLSLATIWITQLT